MFWGANIAVGLSFGSNLSEVASIRHAARLAEMGAADDSMMADAEICALFKKRE